MAACRGHSFAVQTGLSVAQTRLFVGHAHLFVGQTHLSAGQTRLFNVHVNLLIGQACLFVVQVGMSDVRVVERSVTFSKGHFWEIQVHFF